MKKGIIATALLIISVNNFAQDSSRTNPLTFTGYAEAYYQYDFNNPINNTRPCFVYSHNRNNEATLNLAFIKAAYNTYKVRANIALATGTYMNANYSAEQGVMKNVYEANAGIKLSKKSNLWLDAGIFASHIGFESAIGKDCRTLTRSILTDNSPYYESGVKLSYTSKNEQWFLSALVLNGWQRIQKVNGNAAPSFGTQVTFKPSSKVTLNSSTFIGNDKPDSVRQMRYFHNFYGIFQLNKSVEATLGFDAGMEQKAKGSSSMNSWYSPVAIIRFTTGSKTALAVRAEYYDDKNGVLISTGTANGFKTWGFSTNFDYAIANNVLWRVEAKTLDSKDNVFEKRNGTFMKNATCIATSLSISF
jgi:hypothetical protein